MGEVMWGVAHDYADGRSCLVRDRYAAVIQYDNEDEAIKLAKALTRMGHDCRAVPVDLSAENPI